MVRDLRIENQRIFPDAFKGQSDIKWCFLDPLKVGLKLNTNEPYRGLKGYLQSVYRLLKGVLVDHLKRYF